jgi:hypothetical protein
MKLPQVSLRDLFWLVLVCAMGCGWWIDRQLVIAPYAKRVQEWATTANQMAFFIEQHGWQVTYGQWMVQIDGATLPRESDWESLPKR